METTLKVLLVALSFGLMSATCNQCDCSYVTEKESLAAGWCVLKVRGCDNTVIEYPVDEIEYNSYDLGDCYP